MTELDRLIRDLGHEKLPWELLALLGCLAVAYGLCWLLARGRRAADSVLFGRGVVDGVLFPLVALGLVSGARLVLAHYHKVPLLRTAVTVLISLAVIRVIARVLSVAFPHSGMARLVERLFSWLAWIAAVLWIVGLLPTVLEELEAIQFVFGKSKVSLLSLLSGVVLSGLVMVIVLWISSTLERKVLQESVADLSLRKVAANAIRTVLLLVGFLFALSAVGVDLTTLSVLGGAIGVGLGFGLQKLAANYVSGFVILFERSLRIGDTVRVDNFEGIVADIKTRYTLIRSLNGRESVVPNEVLITQRIENLSLADPKVLLTIDVPVEFETDPALLERILLEATEGVQRVLRDPAPVVRMIRFAPDGLDFQLQFWIDDPQNGQGGVKSEILLNVLKGMRANGIATPVSHRVVHLRNEGAAPVAQPGG